MNNELRQNESRSPWLAIGVLLLASSLLSGCIPICIIPGASCDENIWLVSGSSGGGSCSYSGGIEETVQTDYGWVGVHHTKVRCDNGEDRDYWRVVGFHDDRHDNFGVGIRFVGRGNVRVGCESCALDIPLSGEVDDLQVEVWSPFWMRITVTDEQNEEAWDYIVSGDSDREAITTASCKEHRPPVTRVTIGPPGITGCLGHIGDGYWEETAARLRDPAIFDEQAINWVAHHGAHPAEIIAGLSYFANTWEQTQDERSEATVKSLHALVHDVGCSPVFDHENDLWLSYLEVLDEIMSSPRFSNVVEPCLVRLAEREPEKLELVESPFVTSKVLHAFDAEILARIEAEKEIFYPLWLDRLDEKPEPSEALMVLADRHIFERWSEDVEYAKRRMEVALAIAPENAILLRDKVSAGGLNDPELSMLVVEHPDMAPHRDEIDGALIDELSKETISEEVRSTFVERTSLLETYPLSSDNLTQLQDVLVGDIEGLATEAMALLGELDGSSAEKLLARLDAQVARQFPVGSQFFLKRLSDDTLERPDSDVATSILSKARQRKEEEVSIDDKACRVVRRLRYEPVDADKCVLPENL